MGVVAVDLVLGEAGRIALVNEVTIKARLNRNEARLPRSRLEDLKEHLDYLKHGDAK